MSSEYRVCWSASSNISFHGATDWEAWGSDDSADEIEDALNVGSGTIPEGLSIALDASGFEWWAEVREGAPDE